MMKDHLLARSAIVIIALSLGAACSAPTPEPTFTPPPTATPVPPTETPTPKPTATNTPTQTPIPSGNVITRKQPAEANAFTYEGGLLSMPLNVMTEDQINNLIKQTLNSNAFSQCPEIWIEAVPDANSPTYALFINASPDDHDKGFVVMIRATAAGEKADGSVGMGAMSQKSAGKSLIAAGYQPPAGQPNPEELEIQLIFPGCEIYTENVKWPA